MGEARRRWGQGASPVFHLPPGSDRRPFAWVASPLGLGLVALAAGAGLLPFGMLVAWVLAVAGSVAAVLATEQHLDRFPSPKRLRELPALLPAVGRALVATAFVAAPLILLFGLAWIAARSPEEQVLDEAVTFVAPPAFLAFLYTVHAYFPALLTAVRSPEAFAAFHAAYRRQVAGRLRLLPALAYAGLFALFLFRTMLVVLPDTVQSVLATASFVYLHLALSRLAASASQSQREAAERGTEG